MRVFVLESISESIFVEKDHFETLFSKFGVVFEYTKLGVINGFFIEILDDKFLEILPILNGFVGKYFFYDALKSYINENLIFGRNIYDYEYDEKQIKNIIDKIEGIKKQLDSDILITNTKKQQFKQTILDGIYQIGGFLIKVFFLMHEMIKNKKQLNDIINNPNFMPEFKAQAVLLDNVGFDKFSLIKNRFDFLNVQLGYFNDILNKYIESKIFNK